MDGGFYRGFNNLVALASKIIITLIVIWCVIDPEAAGKVLGDIKNWSFSHLNYYYTWGVSFYIIVCLLDVKTQIKKGIPAQQILEFAGDNNTDLIILGSRGLSDVAGFLQGSVSHKVSHLCECTCITVR